MPERVLMGETYVWQRKPKRDLVLKPFYAYVVLLLSILNALLSNDEIRTKVDNPRVSADVLKTITDGKYYLKYPFFSSVPNALGIILYYNGLLIL